MIWGSRNSPPISISSPRETTTSRPLARPPRASSSPPAALLATRAASAPVASRSSASAAAPRRPRAPAARSYSTAAYPAACATASFAAADSGARPRLVCSTTPVAFTTARVRLAHTPSSSPATRAASSSTSGTGPPPATTPRLASSARRAAPSTAPRPKLPARSISCGCPSSTSMLGSARRGSMVMPPLSATPGRGAQPRSRWARTIQLSGPDPRRTRWLSSPERPRRWCCSGTGGTGSRHICSCGP